MKKYILPALAVIGIVLRIVPMWAQQTWYDENFTILLARLPIDRLLLATAGDVHPPLWYLICWPFAHIPGLPGWASIRIPAMLASLASLPVWWQLVKRMASSDLVRLVAFGLFAMLPQQIYYAQEGRMYALLTLLVLLAWWCILERKYILLALVTANMLYLQNYGLLYAAALWLAGIVLDRSQWKRLTVAMVAAGMAYIPWALVLLGQMGMISGRYWMVRISLASVMADFSHVYFANGLLGADMLNIGIFYAALTWSMIRSIRSRTVNIPAVILAFGPILLAGVVSVIWQPIMLYRALTPSGAFVALLLAGNVEHLFADKRRLVWAAIFFVPALIVNLGATATRAQWIDETLANTYTAIDIIDSGWQPGDLLYHADDGIYVTGAVNWQNVDNTLRVPPCGPVLGGLSDLTRSAIGIRMGALPADYHGRIWVVTAQTPMNPICETEYLQDAGLLDTDPVYCMADREIVRACVYLVEK